MGAPCILWYVQLSDSRPPGRSRVLFHSSPNRCFFYSSLECDAPLQRPERDAKRNYPATGRIHGNDQSGDWRVSLPAPPEYRSHQFATGGQGTPARTGERTGIRQTARKRPMVEKTAEPSWRTAARTPTPVTATGTCAGRNRANTRNTALKQVLPTNFARTRRVVRVHDITPPDPVSANFMTRLLFGRYNLPAPNRDRPPEQLTQIPLSRGGKDLHPRKRPSTWP